MSGGFRSSALRRQDCDAGANELASQEALHRITLPALASEEAERTITVRLADSNTSRNSAKMLINRRYSWRGYGDKHRLSDSASHSTFTASTEDQTIGTITLAVDSLSGLAADVTFKDEIDKFRTVSGSKVCELTKLAFDSELPSKPLLAALFHIVFIHGQLKYNCTDLFIEVNPRHRRFYEAMLGFATVGPQRHNQSVSAPSQLMWLKVSNIRKRIDEAMNPLREQICRSLYPFFFSSIEERVIHSRLRGES